MNPDNCPDCARETWYYWEDEQWFHVDPNQECFLTIGKAPTNKHPCDKCGVILPEDEHCGRDQEDGSSEYLCPDCFTYSLSRSANT